MSARSSLQNLSVHEELLRPMPQNEIDAMHHVSSTISYFVTGPDHPAMQQAMRLGLEAGASMNWLTTYFHTGILFSAKGHYLSHASVAEAHAELGGCERVRLGSAPGEDYDKCPGCQGQNHSEARSIQRAREAGHEAELRGSTFIFAGHFWCCEPCTQAMEDAGVARVVLMEGAAALFDKSREGAVLDPADPQRLRLWFESQLLVSV